MDGDCEAHGQPFVFDDHMIFSPNNMAKEWIFRELSKRAEGASIRVLDLACGAGSAWHSFLKIHQNVSYVGSDTDRVAVEKAKALFADLPNASFFVADAQSQKTDESAYDLVTALSALEHVVHIDRFLDTVFRSLKHGGIAYVNYDDGHFYSHSRKERVMVPVSQWLAKIGIEGPYMKEVDDAEVIRLVKERGGEVLAIRKNHVSGLKGAMKPFSKGAMNEIAIDAWFAFEDRLNDILPADQLAELMGATTVVIRKP